MGIISANQFDLTPKIAQRFAAGRQSGQQFRINNQALANDEQDRLLQAQQEAAQAARMQQVNQFAGQALAGDKAALNKVAENDTQKAINIQNFLGKQSEAEREEFRRENDVMTKVALHARTLPPEQVRPFIQRQRDRAAAEGRSTARTDRALQGTDEELMQAIEFQAVEGRNIEDIAKQSFGDRTPTSLQQNLMAAGLKPGTQEFQYAVLRSINKPATQISIGGEKKFQEKLAEGQAKRIGVITEEADAAIDANQSLSVLEAIDVETGALEPAKQGLAAFASAFGLDASGIANVSKGEAFNAEAKRLVLAVKASQKGPQTDKDEFTIRQTVANLGNTKAGNQFIINSAMALNNRKIERKEFYDNFIEQAGGNFKDSSGKTADQAWSEFKRNTPLISSKQRTSDGLPAFYYRFEESTRALNPDATREEILQLWRDRERRAK